MKKREDCKNDNEFLQQYIDNPVNGFVTFPPGNYNLTGTITIKDPINIRDAGVNQTRK